MPLGDAKNEHFSCFHSSCQLRLNQESCTRGIDHTQHTDRTSQCNGIKSHMKSNYGWKVVFLEGSKLFLLCSKLVEVCCAGPLTAKSHVLTSPAHLEAHAGFFRLSMMGNFDVYWLLPFGKKKWFPYFKYMFILETLWYFNKTWDFVQSTKILRKLWLTFVSPSST